MSRFNSNYYTLEKYIYKGKLSNGYWECVKNNGCLFSKGIYPTKIKPEELPPWYCVYHYNGSTRFISTKNVKQLLYKTNKFSNHLHKDDILLISYSNKENSPIYYDEKSWYQNWDNILSNYGIYKFLVSCLEYSDVDKQEILDIINRFAEQEKYFFETFVDDREWTTRGLFYYYDKENQTINKVEGFDELIIGEKDDE